MEYTSPLHQGSFMKGSPDPGDDAYFGGKPGASRKAYDAMIEQYGKEKGEEVYYATRNKHKGKSSSWNQRLAEGDLPQVDMLSVPEKVDTLRKEETCEVCGSSRNHGEKCGICGFSPAPDSLDNPDLNKAKELARQNDPNMGTHTEGFPNDLDVVQTPPPSTAPPMPIAPNFQSSSHTVIDDMDWSFYHPKLGMGKINPIERPVLPTGPPATNEPVRETVITNPTQPVISRTAGQMIAAVTTKENNMANVVTAADHQTLPEAATPDATVGVVETGGVMDASNEAASAAQSQVDVLGVGGVSSDVSPDSHQSLEKSAEGDGDDAGFNETITTDNSGPTMVWDLNYSDSGVERQEGPVTTEPYPASEDGVKKSALDAEPYPSDDGPGLSGGGANSGTEPADPVGKAMDRVDVLEAVTTPEGNNSGPTITWTGTDGNGVERQQDPVTNDTLMEYMEVKKPTHSSFTPHIVNATRLVDMETEMGVLSAEDKYNRLAALIDTSPEILEAQLQTLSRVKTAGLKKASPVVRTAGRMPSFSKAASIQTTAKSEANQSYDESLFL